MLCVGGAGSMRTGMNLVLNFRSMGLYNMLILALDPTVCDGLWGALPDLACVWWPSKLSNKRPASLYNTMFSKVALAFFEARKLLLEQLVITHRLNVLHLDADTVWFANPYPIFKTLYKDYSLIVQTDNPFVNAGVLYVQNVKPGDASAWLIEELNRRIDRFTYRPETVTQLPNSHWSSPPYFANADEQANMNDIVASALIGRNTFGNGVEFYEARFKKDKGSKAAREKMADSGWIARTQQGDVTPARRNLVSLAPRDEFADVVHLCKMALWQRVQVAPLKVPDNRTAAHTELLLAPEWLFSHFPYGAFFPSFKQCHADSWGWPQASALEQRLCMPKFRVPVVMVHMAGLRNGQWGRRGVMRALGVWHEAADQVATDSWVSLDTDRLLVADPSLLRHGLRAMRDFDFLAARLLLLGLLLGRRVVIPPLPCAERWTQQAMEPRHLRALEVGCGPHKQCVWLPMPHFKEAWCSGVDFIYDIDYRSLLETDAETHRDVLHLPHDELHLPATTSGAEPEARVVARRSGAVLPTERVLVLTGGDGGDTALGTALGWLPIDGLSGSWDGAFAQRVRAQLEAPPPGLALDAERMTVVKDCMRSLATSKD